MVDKIFHDILVKDLRDFMTGKPCKCFVHRDDGFFDREPIERYFQEYKEWPEVERKLFKRVKPPVLETGCAIGEHLRYLQNNGIDDATGIDISPGAIKIALERGVKNCFVMDARKMNFGGKKFKTVLMLYYGFGIGGTIEGQKKLLGDLYEITDSDGQIICSSIDALKTTNPKHLAYQDYNRKMGKPYGDITQVTLRIQHDNEFGDWYNLLFINPNGLVQLLKGTKWKIDSMLPEKEGSRAWYYVLVK